MKNKKALIIIFSFFCTALIIYFINNKLNPKEYSILGGHAIIEKMQIPNKNIEPAFFSLDIISVPNTKNLEGIEKEYTLPKIEADQDYIKDLLDKKYNEDDYKIEFNEDGSFEYENKSIKQQKLNLSESDAIKLGKRLLSEFKILHDDAVVYSTNFDRGSVDNVARTVASYYVTDLTKGANGKPVLHIDPFDERYRFGNGYYAMYFCRNINNTPVLGKPEIIITFNTNGISSINYDWSEVKIVNKGSIIPKDVFLDNLLKDVSKTVDIELLINSCFVQFRENEPYHLCYYVLGLDIYTPHYIDSNTGEYMYRRMSYGSIFEKNRF